MKVHPHRRSKAGRSRQDGYVLIVMLLFLTLMAIGLTAMAPAMAQRIRRDREIELIHRGRQYARAIRLFYRKFGRYPVRLEELENTNNIRFLRRRYKDPMTPGGQWRLIHYGDLLQTSANPLFPGATTPGSPTSTPGTAGSTSSPFANTFSASPQPGLGQASATPAQAGTTPDQSGTTTGQAGTTGQGGTTTGQAGTTGSASADSSQSGQTAGQPGQAGTSASPLGSPLGGGPTFGGGPVVGVASMSKKESIKVLNKKTHYNEWEFVYNPQFDLTTAQAAAVVTGQNPLATGAQGPGTSTLGGSTIGVSTPGGSGPGTQPVTTSPGMPGTQPPATTQQ